MELKESVLDGHIIQVGWSKAVKSISSVPHPAMQSGPTITKLVDESAPPTLPRLPSVDKSFHPSSRESNSVQQSYPPVSVTAPVIQIHVPKDVRRRSIIDLLASYVAADGEAFEMVRSSLFRELIWKEYFCFDDETHLKNL